MAIVEGVACIVNDCKRLRRRVKGGYCEMHYARVRRKGIPGDADRLTETHGLADSQVYWVWQDMKRRCTDAKHRSWPNYGGRGIRVCDRWETSFSHFLLDMGERPLGMTLERADVNGDYTPDNCRWADRTTQTINRRIVSSNTSGYRGVSARGSRWVANIGIDYSRIRIGSYADKAEAAWMYDQWALALYDDIAPLNFDYI